MKEDLRKPVPGFHGWVLGLFLRQADPSSPEYRQRAGAIEGWISMGLSILLAATKAVMAFLSGSISLLADAFNNAADIGSSLVIALSFNWSRKPRDPEHPHGHGRVEHIASLVLSILLIIVGIEVARAGVERLLRPQPIEVSHVILAVLALTIVVKAWLALFARALARTTRSEVLEADAWNHTFDILSTTLVLAALVCTRLGWPAVDGWAGLAVAGFIFYTGVRYARSSVSSLVGEAPSPQELRAIRGAAIGVHGVRSVHDILTHRYGDTLLVSFHIEVDAAQTAIQVHDLSEKAEAAVQHAIPCKAIAHVDPVDRSHPVYAEVESRMGEFTARELSLTGFHDLRVTGTPEAYDVSVDLIAQLDVPESEYRVVARRVREAMHRGLQGLRKAHIHVEVDASAETLDTHG